MLPIWQGWSVRDAGCLFESPDSSPLRLCSFCLASRWSGCGVVCIEPLGRSASVIWRLAALMSPIWRGFTLSAALMRSVGESLFIFPSVQFSYVTGLYAPPETPTTSPKKPTSSEAHRGHSSWRPHIATAGLNAAFCVLLSIDSSDCDFQLL